MKALVYTATNEVEYQSVATPTPPPGEVLIKVKATGICGSDMHAYHGHDARRVPPLILGHEIAGVAESGRYQGKRVVLNPLITCGECDYCYNGRGNLCSNRDMIGMYRSGSFADYLIIPERSVMPIPDDMDFVAAALTEPTATSLHAIHLAEKAIYRPLIEQRCVVFGAGSVGLIAALLLKAKGVSDISVIDANPLRLQAVEKIDGLKAVLASELAIEESSIDLIIDAVGANATRAQSMAMIKPGGVYVHLGLLHDKGEFDARKLTLAEITMIGVYTYTQTDLIAAWQALYKGQLGELFWVETCALSDGATAFKKLDKGETTAAKIVLIPD